MKRHPYSIDLSNNSLGAKTVALKPIGDVEHFKLRLSLGSWDIFRLAEFLQTHSYLVDSFVLADAYLDPLPEAENKKISKEMIEMLNTYGLDELHMALSDEYDNLYAIDFRSTHPSGNHIQVERYATVDASDVAEAERLLTKAWSHLVLHG